MKTDIRKIKGQLLSKLKEENAFWSYDRHTILASEVKDEQLISMTMRYLDLDDIKLLFELFSVNKIKKVWKNNLIPEGEYLYTLNRFFAWYYFNAKKPDAYIKGLETRYFNNLIHSAQ